MILISLSLVYQRHGFSLFITYRPFHLRNRKLSRQRLNRSGQWVIIPFVCDDLEAAPDVLPKDGNRVNISRIGDTGDENAADPGRIVSGNRRCTNGHQVPQTIQKKSMGASCGGNADITQRTGAIARAECHASGRRLTARWQNHDRLPEPSDSLHTSSLIVPVLTKALVVREQLTDRPERDRQALRRSCEQSASDVGETICFAIAASHRTASVSIRQHSKGPARLRPP